MSNQRNWVLPTKIEQALVRFSLDNEVMPNWLLASIVSDFLSTYQKLDVQSTGITTDELVKAFCLICDSQELSEDDLELIARVRAGVHDFYMELKQNG